MSISLCPIFHLYLYVILIHHKNHNEVLESRGGSEQSEVSEIGTVGNRKWLKSRNSEIGNQNFFSEIGNRKEKNAGNRKAEIGNKIFIFITEIIFKIVRWPS